MCNSQQLDIRWWCYEIECLSPRLCQISDNHNYVRSKYGFLELGLIKNNSKFQIAQSPQLCFLIIIVTLSAISSYLSAGTISSLQIPCPILHNFKKILFCCSLKEGLYRIQILCRCHPFLSYPAGLTIAELSG